MAPAAQGGHISKWIESIDRINKMDVDVIVPGHGPVGSNSASSPKRARPSVFLKTEAKRRYDRKVSPGRPRRKSTTAREIQHVDRPGGDPHREQRRAVSTQSSTIGDVGD